MLREDPELAAFADGIEEEPLDAKSGGRIRSAKLVQEAR
jgi:hypothetical protein